MQLAGVMRVQYYSGDGVKKLGCEAKLGLRKAMTMFTMVCDMYRAVIEYDIWFNFNLLFTCIVGVRTRPSR
jgi:hypothetical protein